MAEEFKTARPLEFYQQFLKENIRPDGRGLEEYRRTFININSMSTANGSALVRMGDTKVVCGIKAELAEPHPEHPDEGFFVPNVELHALCSHEYRSGPPSDEAQEISMFVADIIKSSSMIDLKSFCIVERKLCWVIYADIMCLSNDGNIIDCVITALYAALKNTTFPLVTINSGSGETEVSETEKFKIDLASRISSTTVQVFNDGRLLVDSTYEEESLSKNTITTVIGDGRNICSIYKPGGCGVKDEDIRFCIQAAYNRANDIENLINNASNEHL